MSLTLAFKRIVCTRPRLYACLFSAALLVLISYIDSATNPDLTLDILYVLPVSLAALIAGRMAGIAFSAAGAIGWYIAQVFSHYHEESPLIRFWDALMLFAIFIIIAVLIDQLRRANEKLAEQHAALKNLLHLKDESLSSYSHDIRGMLSSVVATCYLLLHREAVPPAQHDMLNRTIRSVNSILTMLDSLLDLSRIEAGHEPLNVSTFNLLDVLRDCVASHQQQAAGKIAHVTLTAPADPICIEADRTKVLRIANNLVSNAIKYSPHHGTVAVDAASDGTFARFTVRDSGPGIRVEDQTVLFERFSRLSRTARTREQGTGLGLSIARALTDLHGGRIEVASVPGKGATFTVSLPVRAASPVIASP
jgi:signal transduction histidine kinase